MTHPASFARGRKDANHDDVVGWLKGLGCSVIELHKTGIPGFPDLVVGAIGRTHLVEIKNTGTAYGRAGFSETQMAFNRDWRGAKVWLVSDLDGVTEMVNSWRKGCA